MEIVDKRWGHEAVICNNDLYAAKILCINLGGMCSLHMHPKKDETFFCLSGSVKLEVGNDTHYLTRNDSVRVPPRMWHRFEGLEDTKLLEVSTPHSDEDVERLTQSQSAEERLGNHGDVRV